MMTLILYCGPIVGTLRMLLTELNSRTLTLIITIALMTHDPSPQPNNIALQTVYSAFHQCFLLLNLLLTINRWNVNVWWWILWRWGHNSIQWFIPMECWKRWWRMVRTYFRTCLRYLCCTFYEKFYGVFFFSLISYKLFFALVLPWYYVIS